MIRKVLLSAMAVCTIAAVTAVAAEIDLEGVKCVVAPRPAKANQSAEYKEGKVFFCCGNCKGKFAEDSKPFATAGNAQLVATGQYEQKNCPLSGGPLNPDTALEGAGAKVTFCCNNCKGKVAEADEEKQAELVFSEPAFKKANFAKKSGG